MTTEEQFRYDERVAIGMEGQPSTAPVPQWLKDHAASDAARYLAEAHAQEHPQTELPL